MTTDVISISAASSAEPAERMMPLTWAQENMWDASWGYGPDAHRLNMRRIFRLPRPVPLAEFTVLLADLGSRYDILRTTFDYDAHRQLTHRRIEVPIELIDAGDLSFKDPAWLASRVSSEAFDYASAPPWRVALVCEGGSVSSVALVVSHLAFDGDGASLLRQLVLDTLAGGAPGHQGVAPTQVADLVQYEASDALRTHSDRSLARWRKALDPLPSGCGIRRPAPGSYSVTTLESAAVPVAAQAIAVRVGVGTSVVMAAALNRALLHCLPLPPSLLLVISANRHHPDLARYLGLALQNAYFVIPTAASIGFDDYVRQCFEASVSGLRSARYDNGRFRAEQFATYDQGTAPDLSFFFNDARRDRAGWDGLEKLAGTLGRGPGLPDEPAPELVDRWVMQDCTFFFTLASVGCRCSMAVMADDQLIRQDVAADILNYVRDLLVAEAVNGSAG